MKAKYIVMARDCPIHVIMDAYNVRPMECIKPNGVYNLDNVQAIPDNDAEARKVRLSLIAEARGWKPLTMKNICHHYNGEKK